MSRDRSLRVALQILREEDVTVLEYSRTKHFKIKTDSGIIGCSSSPSDANWHKQFRRDVKKMVSKTKIEPPAN